MLDVDLAALYGVPTKRLNEQVKRNRDRFPADFLFQLTQDEKAEVVANCDHLQNLKFSKALPFAFTEHGAIQAANVLASSHHHHTHGHEHPSAWNGQHAWHRQDDQQGPWPSPPMQSKQLLQAHRLALKLRGGSAQAAGL